MPLFDTKQIVLYLLLVTGITLVGAQGECPPFSDDKECPPPLEVPHQCLIDGDCEEGFRCCSDGCQLGCVEVKAVETDEDTREDPKIRTGLCPAPVLHECEEKEVGIDEITPSECFIDKQCDVGEKCCSDGCKLVCMAVEILKKERRGSNQQNIKTHTRKDDTSELSERVPPEHPEIRLGLCPAPSLDDCEEKEVGLEGGLPIECFTDKECDVGEKCCSDGCNLRCMAVELH